MDSLMLLCSIADVQEEEMVEEFIIYLKDKKNSKVNHQLQNATDPSAPSTSVTDPSAPSASSTDPSAPK
ncbi:hypothetical protein RRG08_016917 [Elysia crispata]|uniref:Uncharacterized protein n=1 Tax=Elysia crispata TaxID=231223 RepID=A0AAE0ZLK8_9GAST|nr:hypothetical protein RRG08_016917 [Elysia crispata]